MKGSIDYRPIVIKQTCENCEYYGFCYTDIDCAALKKLVKIYEDMDSGNPDQ